MRRIIFKYLYLSVSLVIHLLCLACSIYLYINEGLNGWPPIVALIIQGVIIVLLSICFLFAKKDRLEIVNHEIDKKTKFIYIFVSSIIFVIGFSLCVILASKLSYTFADAGLLGLFGGFDYANYFLILLTMLIMTIARLPIILKSTNDKIKCLIDELIYILCATIIGGFLQYIVLIFIPGIAFNALSMTLYYFSVAINIVILEIGKYLSQFKI